MTTAELRRLLEEVDRRAPDVHLVANSVGNLALMDGDNYVGFVDFGDKSVTVFDEAEGAGS